MSNCCDDPTEATKIDPRELIREQNRYGELVRDLLTSDPEKLMLQQLRSANPYLTELAALNAHYVTVRLAAINALESQSQKILQRIIETDSDQKIIDAAQKHLQSLL